MKKVITLSIILIVAFCKSETVIAQIDSMKVEYKQESIDSSDFSFRSKYKYLDILLKEEKSLLKFGIQPTIIAKGNFFYLPANVAFEKKIFPEWSIISDCGFGFSYQKASSGYVYKSRGFGFGLGTRYYYGMKKAIQKGETANNFNSNYFEFKVFPFSYNVYTIKKNDNTTTNSQTRYFNPLAHFGWGIQRRLNNYSFMDTKFLLALTQGQPYPSKWFISINFNIGFGFNIKR